MSQTSCSLGTGRGIGFAISLLAILRESMPAKNTHNESAWTGQYPRPCPLFARSEPHILRLQNKPAGYPLTYSAMQHQTICARQIVRRFQPCLCKEAASRKGSNSLCKLPLREVFHAKGAVDQRLSDPQLVQKKPQDEWSGWSLRSSARRRTNQRGTASK